MGYLDSNYPPHNAFSQSHTVWRYVHLFSTSNRLAPSFGWISHCFKRSRPKYRFMAHAKGQMFLNERSFVQNNIFPHTVSFYLEFPSHRAAYLIFCFIFVDLQRRVMVWFQEHTWNVFLTLTCKKYFIPFFGLLWWIFNVFFSSNCVYPGEICFCWCTFAIQRYLFDHSATSVQREKLFSFLVLKLFRHQLKRRQWICTKLLILER